MNNWLLSTQHLHPLALFRMMFYYPSLAPTSLNTAMSMWPKVDQFNSSSRILLKWRCVNAEGNGVVQINDTHSANVVHESPFRSSSGFPPSPSYVEGTANVVRAKEYSLRPQSSELELEGDWVARRSCSVIRSGTWGQGWPSNVNDLRKSVIVLAHGQGGSKSSDRAEPAAQWVDGPLVKWSQQRAHQSWLNSRNRATREWPWPLGATICTYIFYSIYV